jgi:hypothetical protein
MQLHMIHKHCKVIYMITAARTAHLEMTPQRPEDIERAQAVRRAHPELAAAELLVTDLVAETREALGANATVLVGALRAAFPNVKSRRGVARIALTPASSVPIAENSALITSAVKIEERYRHERPRWYERRTQQPSDIVVTMTHRPHFTEITSDRRGSDRRPNPYVVTGLGNPTTVIAASGSSNSGVFGNVHHGFQSRRLCDFKDPDTNVFLAANANVYRRAVASSLLANMALNSLRRVEVPTDNAALVHNLRAWHELDGTTPPATTDGTVDLAPYMMADARMHLLHPTDDRAAEGFCLSQQFTY